MALKTDNINILAAQANILVRSQLTFSNLEARIFALALGCITSSDTELPEISIWVDDIVPGGLASRGGSTYSEIDKATDGLMKKFTKMKTVTGDRTVWEKYSLMSILRFDSKSGLVSGRFSPDIAPYLLQLHSKFTVVELETLLSLRSAHAQRLYWIMQSYESLGQARIKTDDLRRYMLGDDHEIMYPVYSAFKVNVLTPALKCLATMEKPWIITFNEKRLKRKIDEIIFTIPSAPKTEVLKPQVEFTKNKPLAIHEIEIFRNWYIERDKAIVIRLYDRLRADYAVKEPQAREIVKTIVSEDQLKKVNKVLHTIKIEMSNNPKIKSLGGLTVSRIKEVLPVFTKTKT